MLIRPEPIYQQDQKDAEGQTLADILSRSEGYWIGSDHWWIGAPLPKSKRGGWTMAISGLLLSLLTAGLPLLITAVRVGHHSANNRARYRLLSIQDGIVSCWASRNVSRRQLATPAGDPYRQDRLFWEYWRLPLSKIDRIEIGEAKGYIGTGRDTFGVLDVFTMVGGRRYLAGRFRRLVHDSVEEFRHDAAAFIAEMKAKALEPAPAPTGAEAPPRKGAFS